MTITRDPEHGMVTGSQLGEVVDLTEHNDFGEVSHYTASEGINVLLDILYDRDKAGRIAKKTENVIGSAGPVATYYKYDSRGRLYRVCSSDACGSGDVLSEYLYGDDPNDPNDPGHNSNRTGGFTSAGSITATYDDQDRLLGYNGALSDPINLTDPGGAFAGGYPGITIRIVGSVVRVTTAAVVVVVGAYVVKQIAWDSECLLWTGASKLALALGDDDFEPPHGFERCAVKDHCIDLYEKCINRRWHGPCDDCLNKCTSHSPGYEGWDFDLCHP